MAIKWRPATSNDVGLVCRFHNLGGEIEYELLTDPAVLGNFLSVEVSEHSNRLCLWLETSEQEADFFDYLCELSRIPEHKETVELVIAKLQGVTIEEFRAAMESADKTAKLLNEVWGTP